jgi:hypothetical protein
LRRGNFEKRGIVTIPDWAVIGALLLVSPAKAQSHVAIKATQNIRVAAAVEHAIQIDGVKDNMRCDDAGNIYTPANRGYSSAYGSVVKIMADGKHFREFSLDNVPHLAAGHVEDFEITDHGLYVLAREVTKSSNLGEPVEFGSAYILRFGATGNLEQQARLNTDFGGAKPAGLAVLKREEFLVASYSLTSDGKARLFASVFTSDGSLKRTVPISGDGTQASNSRSVCSISVLRPMTVKAGGLIFVLRGSTREPMYVFSDRGEMIRTVKLQAADVEFSSPTISGNQLIVHQHQPAPPESVRVRVLPDLPLEVFPIFDLDTGAMVQQFEWRHGGELACYDRKALTLMHLGDGYEIIRAEPVKETKPQPAQLSDAPIQLALRWIVPCGDDAQSVPMRGDLAAERYCLSEGRLADQDDVESASIYDGDPPRLGLSLTFTPDSAQKLRKATLAKIGDELGVVLDGSLVFRAVLRDAIGRDAVITTSGTTGEELKNWVARLNAGAQRRASKKDASKQ